MLAIARNPYNVAPLNYLSVNGGLAVVSLGHQLMAVDTLRSVDSPSGRVLWTQDLNEQIAGISTAQGIRSHTVNVPWVPSPLSRG